MLLIIDLMKQFEELKKAIKRIKDIDFLKQLDLTVLTLAELEPGGPWNHTEIQPPPKYLD